MRLNLPCRLWNVPAAAAHAAATVAAATKAAAATEAAAATKATATAPGCEGGGEARILAAIAVLCRSRWSALAATATGASAASRPCQQQQQQQQLLQQHGSSSHVVPWARRLASAARASGVTEASFGEKDAEAAATAAAAAAADSAAARGEGSSLLLRCGEQPLFRLYATASVASRLRHVRHKRAAAVAAAAAAKEKRTEAAAGTPAAAAAAECVGLRVTVTGGGCSGYKYLFAVVSLQEAEREGDLIFYPPSTNGGKRDSSSNSNNSNSNSSNSSSDSNSNSSNSNSNSSSSSSSCEWFVCVPPPALRLLESGSLVAFEASFGGSSFVVSQNTKATSTCSCGHSFGVDIPF
ncbi:hypothetical protein Esti_001169 [Eimeria stiedai]